MKYNPRNISFGSIVYNTDEGYFCTAPQAFIKQNDIYCSLNQGLKLKKFEDNTSDYLSVGLIHPMTELMGKEIPNQVSKFKINLYLLKHTIVNKNEILVNMPEKDSEFKKNENVQKTK